MKLFKLIIALGIGIALGVMVYRDPGYVLLAWDVWTIELPLWLLLLMAYVFTWVLLSFSALVHACSDSLRRLGHAIRTAKTKRADRLLSEGLTLLARADYLAAERRLVKAAQLSPQPLLAYLGAAKAARAQNAEARALSYMTAAQNHGAKEELAVGLEKAKIEIESEDVTQALNTLEECERLAPKHPALTALLLQVALKTHDLDRLRDVLENAASSHATPEDVQSLEKAAIQVLLTHFKASQAFQDASHFFARLPRRLQNDIDTVCAYVDVLIACGEHEKARKLIEQKVKRQWSSELIKRYGLVRGKNPITQLKQAEAWLLQQSNDPNLLLTLGRLYQQQQFWGKAKLLLQKSIGIKPQPEAYFELGQVCRLCNEPAASVKYFEEGLKLAAVE